MQEDSYYGFGMVLPVGTVGLPTVPNKNLYNGQNEWQNDFSNLPDYQQTFYRNYDAATGRFVGIDPEPESAESMTNYQYAGNMPIIANDPGGDKIDISKQGTVPSITSQSGAAGLMYEVGEAFQTDDNDWDLAAFYGDVGYATGFSTDDEMKAM